MATPSEASRHGEEKPVQDPYRQEERMDSRHGGIGERLARMPIRVTLHFTVLGVRVALTVRVRDPVKPMRIRGKSDASAVQPMSAAILLPREIEVGPIAELRQRLQDDGAVSSALEQGGEIVDAHFLERWLKMKKGDVDQAEEAVRGHAAWRAEYMPAGRVLESEVPLELAAKKVFLQGFDHAGRPVVVIWASRHAMGHLEESKRFICYVLDNATAAAELRQNPLGQILVLFDLSGLRLANLDVKMLAAIFEVLQGHYPERLSELWFLNAPFIFWGLWKVVAPLIQPSTRDKIRFLRGAESARTLKTVIPDKVLPSVYGGLAELVPIEEAVRARLAAEAGRALEMLAAEGPVAGVVAPGRLRAAQEAAARSVRSVQRLTRTGWRAASGRMHSLGTSLRGALPGKGSPEGRVNFRARAQSLGRSGSLSRVGPLVKRVLQPHFLLVVLTSLTRVLSWAWSGAQRFTPRRKGSQTLVLARSPDELAGAIAAISAAQAQEPLPELAYDDDDEDDDDLGVSYYGTVLPSRVFTWPWRWRWPTLYRSPPHPPAACLVRADLTPGEQAATCTQAAPTGEHVLAGPHGAQVGPSSRVSRAAPHGDHGAPAVHARRQSPHGDHVGACSSVSLHSAANSPPRGYPLDNPPSPPASASGPSSYSPHAHGAAESAIRAHPLDFSSATPQCNGTGEWGVAKEGGVKSPVQENKMKRVRSVRFQLPERPDPSASLQSLWRQCITAL